MALGVGHWELFAILIVALLLFGSRLPSLMRSLGKSVTEFKRGLREVEDQVEAAGEGEKTDDEGPSYPAG